MAASIGIDALFFLRLTKADIRWTDPRAGLSRGGGQTYFDVPNSVKADFEAFAGVGAEELWQESVEPVGTGVAQVLTVDSRGTQNRARRKFSDQRGSRHPGWSHENGFPRLEDRVSSFDYDADSERAAEAIRDDGLAVFLARSIEGVFYAGFVVGDELPQGWPEQVAPLFDVSERGDTLSFESPATISPLARQILRGLRRKRNVLLIGPPATGKTRAVREVWEYLGNPDGASGGLLLDPDNPSQPFQADSGSEDIPPVVAKEWMTFHQSVTYEEFIVGLRPIADEDVGFSVKPRAGRLLDLAIRVAQAEESDGEPCSGLIVIDEINRGNAARAFGEFITFMDPDYRASHSIPTSGPEGLPVPLPTVTDDGELTQEIDLAGGGTVELTIPWHFPPWILMIATMNSVDRATAPLDSALARRFEQIFVHPDLDGLAAELDIVVEELAGRVASLTEDLSAGDAAPATSVEFSPKELAYLLIRRLNDEIASDFGPDLEIGQGLLYPVADAADPLQRLSQIWDYELLPQLMERYEARPDRLGEILRVSEGLPPSAFAFSPRMSLLGTVVSDSTAIYPPLSDLYETNLLLVKRTLERVAIPTLN